MYSVKTIFLDGLMYMCQSILSMEVKIHEINAQGYRLSEKDSEMLCLVLIDKVKEQKLLLLKNLELLVLNAIFPTVRVKMRFFWVERRTKLRK